MPKTGKNEERRELIIVGGGPAGLTAGLYAARGELDAVLLEKGLPGGQLLITELIDDYPGLENVTGQELAERMLKHAQKFGLEVITSTVNAIKTDNDGGFRVTTDEGTTYSAPALIMTAGGTANKLGVPGEAEYSGRGVSYCALCDGAFFKGETIAVVGGGDAAVEEADYLTRYAAKVYIVHRRDEFRASPLHQKRAFDNPKIEVVWNKVVEEIQGTPTGVERLALKDTVTGDTSTLAVTGCFIFIGFTPSSGIIKGHFDHDPQGYVITDNHMMTSIPGLYAAGDLRVQLTRQITTAVGDATTAAIAVEKYLAARREQAAVGAS